MKFALTDASIIFFANDISPLWFMPISAIKNGFLIIANRYIIFLSKRNIVFPVNTRPNAWQVKSGQVYQGKIKQVVNDRK